MTRAAWLGAVLVAMSGSVSAAGGGEPFTPELLQALLEQRRSDLAAGKDVRALEARIDEVAGQKDAAHSGLFWYRDRAAALRAARAQGKPVLSLRLLGDLACDKSCANSRYFRTVLYANGLVSQLLRERFVLHWESVRPVPVVTIDMGDGRRLERTITGNSVHYVLLPGGEVIDVAPGLYGPGAFRNVLHRALELSERVRGLPAAARDRALRAYQRDERAWLVAYRDDRVRDAYAALRRAAVAAGRDPNEFPDAGEAAQMANSKSAVERPIIRATLPLPAVDDDRVWTAVAEQGYDDLSALDGASIGLMRGKLRPGTTQAELEAIVDRFQARVTLDTVKNDLLLRPRALEWLARGEEQDVDALNRRVYADLFLTPEEDPWLGLDARGEYTALEGDGVVE